MIKRRIGIINDSLVGINYNPERYIRLETQPTVNVEIREFRTALRECTTGALGGGGTDQDLEQRFLQVKRIIERFKGWEGRTDEDRQWTRRVTDVRNWFMFSASERWRADDTEHEHYTDSGGKSGGQKEKLAYTILAASLAYQFGLDRRSERSRAFHFVMIDEAFGRELRQTREIPPLAQLLRKLRDAVFFKLGDQPRETIERRFVALQ